MMITDRAIIRSLPLVAGVLGKTYGVRVEIGGNQAFTNGKVIQLPSLPGETDPDFTGLVRGFLDHEAAHIRDTDFSVLEGLTAIEKNIWNIFEDWRVENKLAELFPGCRQNFNWLIRHLFLKGYDENLARDKGTLIPDWLLFKVRSWDVRELAPVCIRLESGIDRHWPGLWKKLAAVLDRMKKNCPDSSACLEYAREIISILQKETERKVTPESYEDSGEKSEQESEGRDVSHETDDKKSSPEVPEQNKDSSRSDEASHDDTDTNETASDSVSEIYGKRTDDWEKPEDNNPCKTIEWLLSASESELPENLGKLLSKSIETQISEDVSAHIEVARTGTKNLLELDTHTISTLRQITAGMRARFHALLQSKSLNQKHQSRKGRLDTGKLYRTGIDNPRVFTRQSERQGINTAVHILLDCSSSMAQRMKLASQVCHSVAKALEMTGVNTGVTAFPGNNDNSCPQFYTVAPIVRHGQKVHNRFMMVESGSTPMGEALWWAIREMIPLKEKRKLILIITDGDPNNRENTIEAIRAAEMMGMEIFGTGIESPCISNLLPESSINITSLNDLALSMFRLLGKAIIKTE